MSSQYHAASADPEQDRWLDDATENVKKQAFFMKRALDNSDMREALKCAAAMTGELRTSNLSPKNYYELYMDVTNELRELEMHFEEEDRSGAAGRSVVELYEQVQHAGNIVPRLYLLVTVGSVYIKSKKAPAKDILFDLVELCRGVQHPMRGLFLRNYLSQVSKDKLPDAGSEYEGAGGSVADALNFVLNNFGEMTKLWVRMQHQGAVRDRQRREKERRNLRQLVGTNLVRLSEMSGVDLATYQETVLPRVLEQIVNSKDVIAQEYLMDVVIQVFPDDYHLRTLDTFLGTCSQLQKKCNVKGIIIALMNRLSNFARGSPDAVPDDIDMFPLFHKYSGEVIEGSSGSMTTEDVLQLQVALVNFASNVYPERIEYIDSVLEFSVQQLERVGGKVEESCEKYVTQLLTLPLESLGLRILELNSYAALMTFLSFLTRKEVAVSIMGAVVEAQASIDDPEKLEALFRFISPVLKDQDDTAELTEDDMFEFDQEQHLAARLFHLVGAADTDTQYALYVAARKHYGQGGTKRISYSLPPLVFGSLALAGRVRAREEAAAAAAAGPAEEDEEEAAAAAAAEEEEKEPVTAPQVKSKKVFGFVHEIITVLAPHVPEVALRLFLQAAQAADRAGYEAIAYEFVAQAFIVYEDDVSDSRAQFNAITLVVSTLQTFTSFGADNYDTLVTKATQHSAKLLKKPDQCRAVYNCAQLFWAGTDEEPTHRDEARVLECLQRSLKIASNSIGAHKAGLFVEILSSYLYFYDRKCPSISVKFLKGLLALIDEHIPNLDNSEVSQLAKRHYQNTLVHIKLKQSLPDEVGERYSLITEED